MHLPAGMETLKKTFKTKFEPPMKKNYRNKFKKIINTYLSVCVFNGGDVRIIKRSVDKTQNKTSFAYSPSSKSHHTIVIALFRHYLTILGEKKQKTNLTTTFFLMIVSKKINLEVWIFLSFFFLFLI